MMKIGELIEILKTFPPESGIYVNIDEDFTVKVNDEIYYIDSQTGEIEKVRNSGDK